MSARIEQNQENDKKNPTTELNFFHSDVFTFPDYAPDAQAMCLQTHWRLVSHENWHGTRKGSSLVVGSLPAFS